ncbi:MULTISPECIES: succinic semialdehyde dehydrogenase [Isoptericola]|uniref:Succinate-semialdehyde dehydrogenase (NADP(+)) n=1 Tax=Isoptericola sediminis TaxID=2733572 RepID=A0A849JW68_9MICO|nr:MULTISPECIES: succinic semialdehyde dehydrogenase [Isoptericola]MDO8143120.1 succinic semialdehyde dehydrogenase [Isoptericola sp. 178]MDO8146981.1 succinic semialdehyde dehydrogenase [Isoptericola sp. b515]NNU26844.1 succinate-semialdehyde dehydrogenase (NADP(+)) [Isoptericola sediminis]
MATAHEGDGALGDVIDPELPASTYVLEPEIVAPLVRRVVTSHGAGTHRSELPFTGAPLAAVPLSSPQDVVGATRAARAAQHDWAALPLRERARVLDRLGVLVLERQSEILDLIQMESGKSRRNAFEEVADIAQTCRHFVRRAERYLADRREPGALSVLTGVRVHRRPVGVVGIIAPWNFPLTLALSETVPALLAGNAVVLKPDPQTTLSALWASELLAEAGLPDDLFAVVAGGADIGAELVDHVDHVAFTGSTETGRKIAARAGERLIGATLELGGKNPLYVAADADLDRAVPGVLRACFTNAGQLCMSSERLVLHERIAERFLERFVPAVRALTLGTGLDYTADVGSLVSADQLERVAGHVDDALAKGARALVGAVHRSDVGPYFYAPTVLDDVPDDAACRHEETFGPVVAVTRVGGDDEAVRVMNDTHFGLHASIWSTDVARARRLAARVETGTVVVNDGYLHAWGSAAAPMGGMKASGLGRRHGREAIEAVTETQSVVAQRGHGLGISVDALYELGGDVPSRVLTGALRAMRRLRMP